MLRPFYLLLFKLTGWKIRGQFPPHLTRYIAAVAPHTSNWDFVVGLAARSILRMQRSRFLGKSQLFKAPYGWFFRSLGGLPVDRTKKADMVDQVVQFFNQYDPFILAIAPEGTRKKVDRLKTGFYYISKKAGVPIIPCGFDFEKREVVIGQPMYPTDDMEKDMASLLSFYRKIKGKNPHFGISE